MRLLWQGTELGMVARLLRYQRCLEPSPEDMLVARADQVFPLDERVELSLGSWGQV